MTSEPRIEGATTVYAVTSFDRGGNTGFVVHCLFRNREDAERYVAQDTQRDNGEWDDGSFGIEELPLFDAWHPSLDPYVYWQRAAHVYPDGRVQEWKNEHRSEGPGSMPPVEEDPLEPWDGHTQGHCGLHISIFGADADAVERLYQEQLARAVAQSNGTCAGCGRTADFTESWEDQGGWRGAVALIKGRPIHDDD